MSDTPKTDAMMTALLWRTGETLIADVEFADFARQLERENAALREDKARLDYLLEKCSSFVLEDFTTGNRDLYHIDATRAAIDDARAKEGQP